MTIDYRLTVKCQDCYAVTVYTNERPRWEQGTEAQSLVRPTAQYRYVACPACDGEALPFDATEAEPDAEQAAS